MEDRSQEIFSKYDLTIYNTYRTRGALLLETDKGWKLLCSYEGGENRLEFEDALKRHIRTHGYPGVDSYVRNQTGSIISTNSLGEKYIMKDWYDGDECNLKKEDKVRLATENLANLHQAMRNVYIPSEQQAGFEQSDLNGVFEKRTRELKRVKTYIRKQKQKNNFEVQYLNVCEEFYKDALNAMEQLQKIPYQQMRKDAVAGGMVSHGNYTYHNILIINRMSNVESLVSAAELQKGYKKAVTTNFEKAEFGLQVADLYQFMRKVMEKNDWNISLGEMILEEYQKVNQLSADEFNLLSIMLLYPEKFWKITNFYFNNKKSWIPQKNVQKLLTIKEQVENKKKFLQNFGAVSNS